MAGSRPIGIFDSGIGGLTVLRELQRILPHENFIYFADTAHLPYGDKTPEQIQGYSRRIITWLQDDMGARLVVAACHTSSALALDKISPEFMVPLVGTIYPALQTILRDYPYSRLGIIATPASVKSRHHEKALINAGFKGYVHPISCPDFVPLIESGHVADAVIMSKIREYLRPFALHNLDALLFGCTHYPLIKETVKNLLPARTHYIDPAHSIAVTASEILDTQNSGNNNGTDKGTVGYVHFYCSSLPEIFSIKAAALMETAPGTPLPLVTLKNWGKEEMEVSKIAVNQ